MKPKKKTSRKASSSSGRVKMRNLEFKFSSSTTCIKERILQSNNYASSTSNETQNNYQLECINLKASIKRRTNSPLMLLQLISKKISSTSNQSSIPKFKNKVRPQSNLYMYLHLSSLVANLFPPLAFLLVPLINLLNICLSASHI